MTQAHSSDYLRTEVLLLLIALLIFGVMLSGCTHPQPTTFIKQPSPDATVVAVREGLSYEKAWNKVVDHIARNWDIVVLSQEDGYLRTGWNYTWGGEFKDFYRVRLTLKFSPDHSQLRIQTEARWLNRDNGDWVRGTDKSLAETIRRDISGSIGRTSR